MKIEIWSDLVCPWCGLGQHRLDQAVAAFEHNKDVEVVHRSFQLDPNFSSSPRPVKAFLAEKRGMNEAQMKATFGRIEAMAVSEGLSPYTVGDNLIGNTRLAHELLALAAQKGLEDKAWKRLYKAYFGEKRSIFDVDTLVALGVEIGLDPVEMKAALSEGRFRAKVEADGQEARALGSSGVPFVVVDRKYVVSGAQSVETFLQVLQRAWKENPKPISLANGEGLCGDDGCDVPSPSA